VSMATGHAPERAVTFAFRPPGAVGEREGEKSIQQLKA
jgi:hypothetical protein